MFYLETTAPYSSDTLYGVYMREEWSLCVGGTGGAY